MKAFIISKIVYVVALLGSLQAMSQNELNAAQWQEDLRFLQETVHRDYSFLFKKISKEAWDKEVETFYSAIPTLTAHEIKVGFSRMVSLFKYGHTQIPYTTLTDKGVLPVNLYHFEEGIFVEGIHKKYADALGARLLKIGGTPIDEVLEAVRPVVPAENDFYFKGYGISFLTIPAVLHAQGILPAYSNTVTLTVQKDGKPFDIDVTAVPVDSVSKDYGFTTPNETWLATRDTATTPLFLKYLTEKLYYFEYLPATKVMYVRQSSVFNDDQETLYAFYQRLFKAVDSLDVEKLVYDVRLNGGGNNYNNKPLIKAIMARPHINKRGRFFYITGRRTFSAAQNLSNEIQNYTEAIIVGEPTGENLNFYGDTNRVTLPQSGINTYLSFAWWQDMPQWENQDYTIPHLAAPMTYEQYKNNQDPALAIALSYQDSDFILDPISHLTQLFTDGKMEQLIKDATRVAKDPAYRYSDFESYFGQTGYRLFQSGQKEAGLMVLGRVARMYPESQGAWNSLAYAQEEAKLIEKAKASYQKAIDLNPESILGKSARKKLKSLE